MIFSKVLREERNAAQRESSGSNAGPTGVDYKHILQENSS